MPKGELVRKLIASYGRSDEFRAVALQIIEDAERSNQRPLANSLRKSLDANAAAGPSSNVRRLAPLADATDPAQQFLDAVEPERGAKDIVLDNLTRGLVNGILTEHRRGEELRRHRLPLRVKILLCGPPGCGKTLCAEVIARELGLPLYTARLDVLISSFLGETATNLRKMFEYTARRRCVLFLDEFDALARARSDTTEHSELRRVVNTLLLLIERYRSRGLLIAASNLEHTLDEALWRRFDDAIRLLAPDATAIEQMLKLKFKNFRTAFKLPAQVDALLGLSHADIERVCLDAIKRAILEDKKTVSEKHFTDAIHDERRRKSLQNREARRA